jgi:micrococcal nuclease
MKGWVALGAAGLLGIAGWKGWQSSPLSAPVGEALPAAGCRAIDGDTIRCDGMRRVRLLGVDTAELPGHCREGRDCAPGDPVAQMQALQRFLDVGGIRIQPIKLDRYERAVAIVTNGNGDNASCAVIQAGARYVEKWDQGGFTGVTCALRTVREATAPRTR